MSDSPNQTTIAATLPQRRITPGTASRWTPAFALLLFLLAAFLIKDNISADLHRPYLKAETESGVSVTLLQYGFTDLRRCTQQLTDMVQAMQSACPICRVSESSCKSALTKDEYDWLSDTPLQQPSARSPEGVVLYDGQTPEAALATCQLSAEQSRQGPAKNGIRCFAPNVERPYPPEQQTKITTAQHNFEGIVLLITGLVTAILALIIKAKLHPATPAQPYRHGWTAKLTLAGIDTIIMLAAYAILGFPDFDEPMALQQFDHKNLLTHAALVVSTLTGFWVILEHYSRRRPFWDELRETFRTLAIQLLLAGAALFYLGLDSGRGLTLIIWASMFIALPLGRASARALLDAVGIWQRPAIIVGTGDNAIDAYLAINSEQNLGYNITGFLATPNSDPRMQHIQIGDRCLPVITSDDPHATLEAMNRPEIIVALDTTATPEKQRMLRRITSTCQNIHFVPSIRGLPLFGTQLSHFFSHDVLFLTVRNNLSRRTYRLLKRGFDIVGALTLLVLLAPLMAYVAWRIWREDGGPVIFHQPRMAKGGGEFGFLKFRSMVKDADTLLGQWRATNSPEWQRYYANNFKLDNDPRVLKVGKWIRGTSIDELPQLINVLRGDMSLVGPRPLLARELNEYGDSIRFYEQANPGITGLWQISGRSRTTFNDRAMMDEWYVQNWSLWYDVAILFKTVDVVLNRRGAC